MNQFLRRTLSVLWRFVFANLICIFAYFMVATLCTTAFTKDIGYNAYGTLDDSSSTVYLYTYYEDSGEDTLLAEYEQKGYTVTTSSIRSELAGWQSAVLHIISQIVCLVLTTIFLYSVCWSYGFSDRNKVHFNRIKEDKLSGAKIGLAATGLHFIVLLVYIIFALGVYPNCSLLIYKLFNASFIPALTVIFGDAATAGEATTVGYLFAALLLLIPSVITGISYLLGYKDISITEKLIYKNNKKKDRVK